MYLRDYPCMVIVVQGSCFQDCGLSTERVIAHSLYFLPFSPGVKRLAINEMDACLYLFTWLYEGICIYLKLWVFKCCNMSLFEHMLFKYVSSCIAYCLSCSVRPCEPTICAGSSSINFVIVCLHVNLLCMLGWVLRVCDPSSWELRCVAVELWVHPLWFSLLQAYFVRL